MNARLSFTIPAIAFASLSFAACSAPSTGTASAGADSAGTVTAVSGIASTDATTSSTASTSTASSRTASSRTASSSTASSSTASVTITGGHETNPADNGRPVVLVASLLGVTPEVFREAFSGVTPAAAGDAPESAQVSLNKQALLSVLGPYGVTNDALDTASNTYRYSAAQGETWYQSAASATATVVDGQVTTVTITDAGHGYTSAPTVTITMPDGSTVSAIATVAYTDDPATNGSLATITLP